ncbi:ArnT family glycosyltransferase [Daeguia caeni]|uniref:ArnT family glycosyltransferase n=1 Tax=Daeguia caeni TaxID=439612 RepID=UPI0035BBC306
MTFVSNGAGLDDAEQLANMDYLDWGYGGSQPPLYTWLAHFMAALFGTNLFTLQLVKFGLLASLFVSVFYGLRLLGFSNTVSAAGMLGLFLIPQIGWESQRALTHSVAGTTACGWILLTFAWHMHRQNAVSALLFGLAMAAAPLGKLNATFFIVMVLVTGLSIAPYRKVLLSRLSCITLLGFLLVLAPTAFWMLTHKTSVIARSGKLQIGATGNALLDRLTGAVNLFQSTILFLSVALIVAAFVATIYFARSERLTTPRSAGELFMRRIVLIGLGIVLAGVLVTGASHIKDRWLQPILFLGPAVLACRINRFRANSHAVRDFGIAGAIAALLVPPILSYNLVRGSNSAPYGQLDYAAAYEEITASGPFKVILTDNPQLPGNFRLFDPSLHVVHAETPDPETHLGRPLLVMWLGGANPNERMAELLKRMQISVPAAAVRTTTVPFRTRPDHPPLVVSYFLVQD